MVELDANGVVVAAASCGAPTLCKGGAGGLTVLADGSGAVSAGCTELELACCGAGASVGLVGASGGRGGWACAGCSCTGADFGGGGGVGADG